MRKHVLLGLAVLLSCSGEDPATPDAAQVERCCDNGTTRVVRLECLPGEIGLPVSRCDAEDPDAGTPDAGANACGNGTLDPGEACDLSAAANPCVLPMICGDCQCVSRCGDDTVDPEENCERNPQCTGVDEVCRRCQCRLKTTPAEFRDRLGDGGALPQQIDFDEVEMTIAMPPAAELLITMADIPRPLASDYRLCLVLVQSAMELQRLCWALSSGGMLDVRFRDMNGERSVLGEVTAGMTPPSLTVPASLGLMLDEGIDFFWVSEFGGAEADRLPDQGVFPLTDVLGRE